VVKPTESRIVLGDDQRRLHPPRRGNLLFKDLGSPVRLLSPYGEDDERAALL
jgi:hypothetical protein